MGFSMASEAASAVGAARDGVARRESAVLKGHEGAVLCVAFSKGAAQYAVSGGKDKTVRLWNPNRSLLIKTYVGHTSDVRGVTCSSDNSKLASCGTDRTIVLWDVASGRIIRKFRGHTHEVNAVKFNNECSVAVSGAYDKTIRVWDMKSRNERPIQVLDEFRDSVTSVIVTDTEVIGGSVDGSVRTFDIRAGRTVADMTGQPVTCVSLSNDANCVLASCLDDTLRLIDRQSGELLTEYTGHINQSFRIDSCLTNDDAYVVSGSEDGRVCYWDLVEAGDADNKANNNNKEGGNVTYSFVAHEATVCGLAFHPSETCLLTCSVDGLIKTWR